MAAHPALTSTLRRLGTPLRARAISSLPSLTPASATLTRTSRPICGSIRRTEGGGNKGGGWKQGLGGGGGGGARENHGVQIHRSRRQRRDFRRHRLPGLRAKSWRESRQRKLGHDEFHVAITARHDSQPAG